MSRTPPTDHYIASDTRRRELLYQAGQFLARYLREEGPHPEVSLRIAEDMAREANTIDAEMKEWRLANGYGS